MIITKLLRPEEGKYGVGGYDIMTLLRSPFESVAHSLALTLRAAKNSKAQKMDLPKDTYHIYADEAATQVLCVSNHGHNGFKSAALSIHRMEDLTIDGNGSTFILHGAMDFAIVSESKNITIRNLTVTCADTCNFQGKVTEAANGCVTVELEGDPQVELFGDMLVQRFDMQYEPVTRTLDYVAETKQLRRGTGDHNFGATIHSLRKTLEGSTLRIYDAPVMPSVGDVIVFATSRRCNQAFLLSHSQDVTLENVTVHTCWGMGLIAQKCRNVTVRGFSVTPEGDRCWSSGQDATHFCNCSGRIVIESCLFENQLDDAVNLHGIYTKIEKVLDDRILVRYAHHQTRGISIYNMGDDIQMLDPKTQMPTAFARVANAEVLNPDLTILTLREITGDILPGMVVENLSDAPDALLSSNIVRNNRSRGFLIGVKGKVEIRNNHFHNSGAAIQFEASADRWMESGSVRDVVIEDNFFDDCMYGKSKFQGVIDVGRRPVVLRDFYFHDRIAIRNNRFTQRHIPCVWAENVGDLIFDGNVYTCPVPVVAEHCVVNGEKVD